MKYGLRFFMVALVLLVGLATAAGAADQATDGQPSAVFDKVKHEFDKVVDGTQVTQDFTVKNTGSGVLQISRVKTG